MEKKPHHCYHPDHQRVIGGTRRQYGYNKNYDTYTSLFAKKERSDLLDEYDKRGNVLFAIVLLTIVWTFTLPLDLRREHFCFSRECRLDNTGDLCYNCVSIGEWTKQVVDYYKGGGGINFDLSVEKW